MQLCCRRSRYNIAALIALAVAAFLLFPAISHAALLSEVPKGHWSYQAVKRLADVGIADPLPEKDTRLPIDRYELARRIDDVRSIVEAVRSLDFTAEQLPVDTVRGVKARVVAAEIQVEWLRTLIREVESRMASEGPGASVVSSDYDAADGGVGGGSGSGASDGGKVTLTALWDLLASIEPRYREMSSKAAHVWSLDEGGSGQLADGRALSDIGRAFAAIALEVSRGIERVLTDPSFDPAQTIPVGPVVSVGEIFAMWVRWDAHGERSTAKAGSETHPASAPQFDETGGVVQNRADTRSKELAKGFEALEIEYATELALIRPAREGYGWSFLPGERSAFEQVGGETGGERVIAGPSDASVATFPFVSGGGPDSRAGSGIAGVLDRLVAGVTAQTGPRGQAHGLEYGWSPATGLGARAEDFSGWMQSSSRIGAEYPVSVSGVEIKAGVGWETFSPRHGQESEATLEASLPMFGNRRGGIGAAYTVVDLDRLHQLTSHDRERGEGVAIGDRENHMRSWTIGGTVPLGDVASIKVGYEVRSETDSPAGASDGLLGAGLEYYLGAQGKVRAEYQWGTVDERRGSSTGVDIGYRIGENTSLSASYSMIQFDAEGDTYRDNLGAAELEVRF